MKIAWAVDRPITISSFTNQRLPITRSVLFKNTMISKDSCHNGYKNPSIEQAELCAGNTMEGSSKLEPAVCVQVFCKMPLAKRTPDPSFKMFGEGQYCKYARITLLCKRKGELTAEPLQVSNVKNFMSRQVKSMYLCEGRGGTWLLPRQNDLRTHLHNLKSSHISCA